MSKLKVKRDTAVRLIVEDLVNLPSEYLSKILNIIVKAGCSSYVASNDYDTHYKAKESD